MKKHKQWRLGAIAGAAALLGSVACFSAHALSLGRITVQSTLGEPLRAEIDVADISPDEALSLKAGLGSPDAFKAAGLEFSPALNDLTVSLQKRPDGRSFLRLRGSRPVNEPFVDLLIQTRTANGSLSRDYAVLIDPPTSRASNPTAVAPTAPVLSRPAAPSATAEATPRESPAKPAAPRAESSPRAKAPVALPPASGDKQVTVKAGDTAGRIAAQNKPDGVSLDQMLLAMQRGNPAAFIGGNVNRIKAGAVLDLPSADTASAINSAEASQTILTQSRNFNEFRRKFAQNVPTAVVSEADRAAGGKITARVDDRAASGATPDKLTLSKGSVQAKAGTAEDAIAKKREAGESSARVAELSKNISELNKLGAVPAVAGASSIGGAASQGAASGAATGKAPVISIPVPAPATGATAAASAGAASTAAPSAPVTPSAITRPLPATSSAAGPVPVTPATPMTAASAPERPPVADGLPTKTPLAEAPAAAASTVAPTAPIAPSASIASAPVRAASASAATRPVALPKPEEGARFLDDLLENPLVLPLAAGLLALLAGFGIYRYSRRSGTAAVDSSFLESRLQPDSFFGASGGQHIDTNEANATGSSLVYSPSQLDAAGDVDPVAEADVYLAYGRDLQAEEILKEALRTSPTRVAIHSKLCEIYAKRRDAKAFEVIAAEALKLTSGKGTEWSYICELGQELDPGNALYRSGGAETAAAAPTKAPVAPTAFANSTPQPARADLPSASSTRAAPAVKRPVEVDFDLDLDIEPTPKVATRPVAAPVAAAIPVAAAAPVIRDLPEFDMDFGPISGNAPLAQIDTTSNSPPKNSFKQTEPPKQGSSSAKVAAAPPAEKGADDGMLEFNLDSLSLDLNEPITQSQVTSEPGDDPLQTKFSLAEEFRSLGDAEGARSLAEEVLSEARGPLKVKAQAFLNALV